MSLMLGPPIGDFGGVEIYREHKFPEKYFSDSGYLTHWEVPETGMWFLGLYVLLEDKPHESGGAAINFHINRELSPYYSGNYGASAANSTVSLGVPIPLTAGQEVSARFIPNRGQYTVTEFQFLAVPIE